MSPVYLSDGWLWAEGFAAGWCVAWAVLVIARVLRDRHNDPVTRYLRGKR